MNGIIRKLIFDSIEDFFSDLFFYARKENGDYPPGIIEDYIRSGVITVDEIVDEFRKQLEKNVKI